MRGAASFEVVAFDDVVVDLAARTIERAGRPVPTEPQVFDVLALLIANRERVVTKTQLLDEVWGDRFVSPATLTSRVRDLRAAVGDSGRGQRVIRTAHGRGFQFVAELHEALSPDSEAPAGNELRPLVGRVEELGSIRRGLETDRLVTLVGPGGVGKTHLMRHAVADLDAVVVELAHVRDDAALARSLLAAAGGTERTDVGPNEAALQLLSERSALVVLDNCEHVLDQATTVIVELLDRCPHVQVLATSRRPLQVGNELVIRVGPLDEASALELFTGHARRHGVDLTTAGDDGLVIDELCQRLDRLPLALELAATKSRAIPLVDLMGLLDDRFSTLVTDDHPVADAPEHHRSLDAAIAWSVDLLSPDQRSLLLALSAIVGDFDLATATAVAGRSDSAVVADLVALVDVSLVTFDPAAGRYGLLESIRMFAERMGVEDAARERFRDHLVADVERLGPLGAATFSTDLSAIRLRLPAVRSIVAHALTTGDTATVHRLVAAMSRFAEQTFSFEVLDWALDATELDDRDGTSAPSSTHVVAALLLTHRSDFDAAGAHLARSEDAPLRRLGELWLRYFTGDLDGADRAATELRELEHGSGSYEEIVATIASQFLDHGAERPFDSAAIARLDELAAAGDPGVWRGAELCEALRLERAGAVEAAVERLTRIVDEANHSGWAFLASGASTARSVAVAASPAAASSVRVLRATLGSYASVGSWQFALADFGAVALALVRHDRAAAAAELLGARAAAGYVGDASNEVADQAAAEARRALGNRQYDDAARHGSARNVRVATRLAIAALDEIVEVRAS